MPADLAITGYEHRALRVPERPVGDSQTHVFETDAFDYLYLELDTDAGVTGVGVDLIELRAPGRPSVETLRSRVDAVVGDAVGESAFSLLNRRRRHRGGVYNYYESGSYGPGVGVTLDMALWDACAKHVDQPLYAFMGGADGPGASAPAYASGLSFVNADERTREVYRRFGELGEFDAAKVKVGHDSVDADVERLDLVDDAMGGLDRLMIDPNEAWSPSETLRRLRIFREAGFDVFWVEDPVFRHDLDGMGRVVENTPETHVTVGEYLGFEEKRSLLDAGACDVLNSGADSGPTGGDARAVDGDAGRDQYRPRDGRDERPRRAFAAGRRGRRVLLSPAVRTRGGTPLRDRGRRGGAGGSTRTRRRVRRRRPGGVRALTKKD